MKSLFSFNIIILYLLFNHICYSQIYSFEFPKTDATGNEDIADYDYEIPGKAELPISGAQTSTESKKNYDRRMSEFIKWAEGEDRKEQIVRRIPTRRPSESELSDNQDQAIAAIGSIRSVRLLCQNGKDCKNCFQWRNNNLQPAPCPTFGRNSGESLFSTEKLMIVLSCTIFLSL